MTEKSKDYLLPTDAILNLVNNIKGEIIVFIKNGYGQLIPLEVTPKDKISSVKEQIQKIEGTLPSQQDLFFGGQVLLDENELQFYRIYHFSIIELKPSINSQAPEQIKISFKLPSIEEPFQTSVDPMIQVKNLKSIIESIIGLKSSEQKLVFQCKQLEDEFTLHHYSITDNLIILVSHFELKPKPIKITVNLSSEKALTFEMNVTDFTKELKMKIKEQTGFPVEKQVLIRKFSFLNDDDSLQAQKIKSDQTVNLYLIERGGFYIQVKVSCNKYLPIEVTPDDTILDIKKEILKREGIPTNERTLYMFPDDKKVSESNLVDKCTVAYMPWKQGSEQMFLKTLNGKYITLYLRLDDEISEIFKVIELMEGVPISEQRIIFCGKQLDGKNKTLNDYNVAKCSTLHLVLRLRG